jgi:histidinol-phosphate aminotransferase
MSYQYERPAAADGLRLHLNENTAGCSPRVLGVLRQITREQAAVYPEYDAAIGATAAYFEVAADQVLLTNGLDEGILLATIAAMRNGAGSPFDAIIVQPAFDMYAACVDAIGGRIVDIPPQADFFFPLHKVTEAIRPETRIIFVTNPNNPTGLSIPRDTVAAVARAAPHAIVFLDEAYADFSGESMIREATSGELPNLIIGRTFAKAFGLAGIRVGALVGEAASLAPMRRTVPPYTINVYAAAALPAALEDTEYFDWYITEVRESKRMLYDTLARVGVRFWPSDGNFVLACFGDDLRRVVAQLAERGIFIRDKSDDPGCAGCARITAGVLDHTRRLIAALEEILCDAR